MKKIGSLFLTVCLVLSIGGCARVPRPAVSSLPPVSPLPPSQAASLGFYHVVSKGETLYRIAKTYQVDLPELMRVNGIQDAGRLETGQELLIPRAGSLPSLGEPSGPLAEEAIHGIVGPKSPAYGWETITVHHSGTLRGNARLFHRDHLRRRMGGLFYHFVIGNGDGFPDGAIEAGWRWKKQVKANRPHDVQICLIGDFSRQEVSEAQLGSLVKLIRILRNEYGIPLTHIRQHRDIKNKHTECPGRNFPFYRLLTLLTAGGGSGRR
ncbi:MAG: N-acetylmuramoyl-L-alanine amidase [Candidatus Omnitrophica bacterium]|nr:N-acetylmuramoyl-L-alanine amidase [Candidatus Omnitrophota bacterium]